MISSAFGNKGIYALLSEYLNCKSLDKKEVDLIQDNVPWTRFIEDRTTKFQGNKINLVDYIKNNKDMFVIKPCLSYSGIGVLIGKETDYKSWCSMIDTILKSGDRYVVQKFVEPDREDIIIIKKSNPIKASYHNCYGGLFFNGKFSGLFIRNMPIDKTNVINISRGSTFSVGYSI